MRKLAEQKAQVCTLLAGYVSTVIETSLSNWLLMMMMLH